MTTDYQNLSKTDRDIWEDGQIAGFDYARRKMDIRMELIRLSANRWSAPFSETEEWIVNAMKLEAWVQAAAHGD